MSVRTERSASGKNKSNATTQNLFRGSKDEFVEERCFIASLRPLQFVLICKIKDSLPERARFLHFLVYSFGDTIENKLKQIIL